MVVLIEVVLFIVLSVGVSSIIVVGWLVVVLGWLVVVVGWLVVVVW